MNEVRCPKCKDELQFPFMICPECRWKARGKAVPEHSRLAETYIVEHPEDRDQLRMVLDMVMKEFNTKEIAEFDRKANVREKGRKIRTIPLVVIMALGLIVGSFFLIMVLLPGGSSTPNAIGGAIRFMIYGYLVAFISLIFLVLKFFMMRTR